MAPLGHPEILLLMAGRSSKSIISWSGNATTAGSILSNISFSKYSKTDFLVASKLSKPSVYKKKRL